VLQGLLGMAQPCSQLQQTQHAPQHHAAEPLHNKQTNKHTNKQKTYKQKSNKQTNKAVTHHTINNITTNDESKLNTQPMKLYTQHMLHMLHSAEEPAGSGTAVTQE
jgi:hypothetical protein